ncbi:MAG: cysteine dioxygenase family protein [Thermoleophilia bacterium]|nr:cysteine dioxygenase family protein [Thermoleophilia bacterium]
MATVTPLPAAAMSTAELARLVESVAADPVRWRPLVRHGRERECALLHRDERVEVWVISWSAGHDTGFHDHGPSEAAIAVPRGALTEERLTLTGAPAVRRLVPGPAAEVPRRHVHRVRHTGGAGAVSIHAYSPPLREMGAYGLGDDGLLERSVLHGGATLSTEIAPAPPDGAVAA